MNDRKENKVWEKVKYFFRWAFDWFNTDMFLNLLVVALVIILINNAAYRWQSNEQWEQAEIVLDNIAALITTATEDEYAEIAEEIHHSMIRRSLTQEDLEYLDMIPNTSENCPFEVFGGEAGMIYLTALNTGAMYELSVYNENYPSENAGEYGNIQFNSGYDEISLSGVSFITERDNGTMTASISRKNGEISIHRMKRHFCEDCIHELAELLTDQSVLEFVIFDAGTETFYPIVESAEYSIGGYAVSIRRDTDGNWNDYDLNISYTGP